MSGIELAVAVARIEEKVDGVNQRLDKLNGSVARLQDASNRHDSDLTVLNTEKDLLSNLVKPVLVVLCIVVAGLLGHQVDVKVLLELFGK